ncbi:rod shape-determining protein MreD [Evansella sp. LMS18]|uniref:rod shape-determining protein MreD n=1 Tax=Evansella sp. LMS18 TaxID=2924033 RepID=UPI0020D10898|nr:rod shape-determining protein MreD [Evansella sp. LMS18]UTR11235.1 rod shape-determining protein MreD [Evansella sp. LMS18]
MMRKYSLFLVLFVLFIIEGTVFQIFAPDQFGSDLLFIPRWSFMLIIFAGIFRGRGTGTLYGVIFGVMFDVIYSSLLGIYTFAMGLLAYLLSISIPFFQRNLPAAVFLTITAVILLEYFLYGMMLLLGMTAIPHHEFLYSRFLPSLAMNFFVLAAAAYPLRKWFEFIKRNEDDGLF